MGGGGGGIAAPNIRKCDAVLDAIGNGKFQYVAALICGLANAADAVELLCVSFILPELEGITDYEKGALSASVFVGMLVGGILAGVASDAWGRKPLLAACLLLNGVFGLLSVAAPTWPWLAACRVIAGVGVGGSIPGVFGLFSEFLPVAKRGFFISLVAWQWMVGTIYTAGAAWVMIGVAKLSWRWFAAVCSIPALACFLLVMLVLPESPRFLFTEGRFAACDAVLQRIAAWNGVTWQPDMSVVVASVSASQAAGASARVRVNEEDGSDTQLLLSSARGQSVLLAPPQLIRRCRVHCRWSSVVFFVQELRRQAIDFWKPSLRRTSALLLVIWFALSFGWYGLVLWIPSIFKAIKLDLDPYQDSFLVAAANLPGNIVATLLMDRVGRKRMLVASLVLGCASCVLLRYSETAALVIFSTCFLNAVSVGSWNTLDCLSTESFPTHVRTSAMGFLSAAGRCGSIAGQLIFGALVSVSVPALVSTAGAMLAVGACAGFFLPLEPAGQAMAEDAAPAVVEVGLASMPAPLQLSVTTVEGTCDPTFPFATGMKSRRAQSYGSAADSESPRNGGVSTPGSSVSSPHPLLTK